MGFVIGIGPLSLPGQQAPPKLGDQPDGNRSLPVHVIKLRAEAEEGEEGSVIAPDDEPVLPFSLRQTCGECHSYQKISSGWHFNALDPCVPAGRSGQPWILVDPFTATQLPLSYRPWPGTYNPEDINLTAKKFVKLFGRHMPGGGVGDIIGEQSDDPDAVLRALVTGKMEINCLSCHDGEPAHNQEECASQLAKDNFRWAATATCGFAEVSGSAKDMPDMWDPFLGEPPEDPKKKPPQVEYDHSRFLKDNKVFIDVRKQVPAQRCYFCHSTSDVTCADHVNQDEDVHMKAGLTCVDCHRNGINHAINRSFEGEQLAPDNMGAATLSCKGCHLGDGSSAKPIAGRLGAPMPEHKGIPTVHFNKLTCTACHSGPRPSNTFHYVKTSRAHALGTKGVKKDKETLPHIISGVYAEGWGGKIGPHKLVWPAFWGFLQEGQITPILPETVKDFAGKALPEIKANLEQLKAGNWAKLTPEVIINILKQIGSQESEKGKPVYISGGKLHRLDEAGKLVVEENPAAQPYTWPLAHNVRPASQSLGIGGAAGCAHCHTPDAAFFFAQVPVDSPVEAEQAGSIKMVELQPGIDALGIWAFNFSFVFRPMMKITVLLAAGVLALILLWYGMRALAYLSKVFSGNNQ